IRAASRFFFSSRRRHTRFSRDWSSDVCSSDLGYESSTVTLQNLSSLLVTLRALNEELEEVVVLGYGSIKKSNLTGSVSRLDKRRSEERRVGKECRDRGGRGLYRSNDVWMN